MRSAQVGGAATKLTLSVRVRHLFKRIPTASAVAVNAVASPCHYCGLGCAGLGGGPAPAGQPHGHRDWCGRRV